MSCVNLNRSCNVSSMTGTASVSVLRRAVTLSKRDAMIISAQSLLYVAFFVGFFSFVGHASETLYGYNQVLQDQQSSSVAATTGEISGSGDETLDDTNAPLSAVFSYIVDDADPHAPSAGSTVQIDPKTGLPARMGPEI